MMKGVLVVLPLLFAIAFAQAQYSASADENQINTDVNDQKFPWHFPGFPFHEHHHPLFPPHFPVHPHFGHRFPHPHLLGCKHPLKFPSQLPSSPSTPSDDQEINDGYYQTNTDINDQKIPFPSHGIPFHGYHHHPYMNIPHHYYYLPHPHFPHRFPRPFPFPSQPPSSPSTPSDNNDNYQIPSGTNDEKIPFPFHGFPFHEHHHPLFPPHFPIHPHFPHRFPHPFTFPFPSQAPSSPSTPSDNRSQ